LAKLERLSNLLEESDPQKVKAQGDLESLNEQFGKLIMSEE